MAAVAGTSGGSGGGATHHVHALAPPTDITALPLDAWATIGSHLSLTSLMHLSLSCQALHTSIAAGSNLWAAHAAARWGPHATSAWVQAAAAAAAQNQQHGASVVVDWPQAYWHAHHAGCQLRTRQPLAVGPLRLEEQPAADEFHASLPASARLLFCRSSSTAGSSGEAAGSLPSGVLAAAVDSRLAWWRVEAAGGGRPRWVVQDARSASTFGGAYVSAMCELPAASGAPGAPPRFASGDRASTIKVWDPLSSSSSSSSAQAASGSHAGRDGCPLVATLPTRALRGHSGAITALQCLFSSNDGGSSSMHEGTQHVPVLASASADKTVRLWSLPASGSASASSSRSNSPLLATLRGHGDVVTCLLPHGHMLLSGSRDRRCKLWDVSEGRQSCVATWRLPGPCLSLLAVDAGGGGGGGSSGGHPNAFVAVQADRLTVLDTRVRGSSSSSNAAAATAAWPSAAIAAAAAHGTIIAAGGRRGVSAWDVRALTSSSGSSSRPMFAARMPRGEPVAELHLDRCKLVAATRRAVLHSAGGIVVWDVARGALVQQLSPSWPPLSLLQLRLPPEECYDDEAARQAAALQDLEWQTARMLPLLSSRAEREEVNDLLGEHRLWVDELLQQQQHAEQHQASSSDTDNGSTSGGSDWSDDGDGSAGGGTGVRPPAQDSRHAASLRGILQPGALALHVDGSLVATVDNSTGEVWLRDFSFGTPPEPPPFRCAAAAAVGGGCEENGSDEDGSAAAAGLGKFWA